MDEIKRAEVVWNRPKLEQFAQVTIDAVKGKQDNFEFDGHVFLVSYAKYLIEYLDTVLL